MQRQKSYWENNRGWCFEEPEKIAAYCQKYWPADVAHILRVADEVCRGIFLFDLKWDMERTYEPIVFTEKIDWNIMPAGDPEFIWQFNRHRFFICLGQAYQLTGDTKYAECFAELLEDWIDHVPLNKETENGPWRSLETGIRGECWTKAIACFKDSPVLTEQLLDKFIHSLYQHAERLVSTHYAYKLMSNWGIIENHGLFEIAMALPKDGKSEEYARIALEHLETECRMQIMRDGVQWEQSPMYHNEVLHCYEDVMILAEKNHIEVPESIRDAVYRMAMADVAWKKPDHHQVLMGDSDDTDVRDYISVAAYLFRDPRLKFGGLDKLDFESIWDLGLEAAGAYEAIEAKEPEFTSIALEDSGNYYIRSDWSEKANFLHFHCGTLGAGHGHSDLLHIDLAAEGEDILVDSGRYTYVAGADRYEFKDPAGHNTILVDGENFTVCKDSWECSKLSQPVKQQFVDGGRFAFVQGGHLGYMELEQPVFVNRKIIYIKKDIYILMDEMYTTGEHTYEQYFHFNNYGKVTLEEGKIVYTGEKATGTLLCLSRDIRMDKIQTRISRHYNLAETNETVKITRQGEGFTSLLTVIHTRETYGGRAELKAEKIPVKSELKGTYYREEEAEAVKFTIAGEEYVVIICHKEVNSPTDLVSADGCIGFGNVIVFDKKEMTEVGHVLVW